MKQGVGTRRTLLGQGINSFVWTLSYGTLKFYHQQNNVVDSATRALTADGVFYTEPKYSGFQAGVVSGAFAVNVRGLGIMVLTASNTYTGLTTVEQGSNLQIGNNTTGTIAGALVINSGAVASFLVPNSTYTQTILNNGLLNLDGTRTYILTGVISGTGSINKKGTSTVTLQGTTNTYTGGTLVSSGILIADNSIAFGTNTVNILKGAVCRIRTSGTFQPVYNNSFTGEGTLEVSASSSNRANFYGSFVGLSAYSGSTPSSATDPVWYGISGNCRGAVSMAVTITTNFVIALESGATTVQYDMGSLTGDSTTQIYGSNQGTGIVTLSVGALNTNTTFAGVIKNTWSSTGTVALTKVGTATLTLTGVNTYTGNTNINQGQIFLTGAGSIANSARVFANGILDIQGITTSTSIISLAGAGTVRVGTKLLTISNNGTTTFTGVFEGSSIVTLTTGNLTLTGNSSKTGGYTVNGGTLTLAGGIFGTGILRGLLTVNNGGVGIIDNTTNAPSAFGDIININAGGNVNFLGANPGYLLGFNLANNGTLSATATATTTGGIQVANGVLGQVSFINSTGTGNGLANTVSCRIRLILNGAGGSFTCNPTTAPLVISGIIDDFSGLTGQTLTKTGAGDLRLTGANTYVGPTAINQGMVTFQNTNQTATTIVASGAIVTAGTTQVGSIKALTFNALSSQYNVYALLPTSASKLTCTTLTASLGFTINVLGTMNAGTYPILVSTTGTPIPTLGTNTTGRTVTFSWSGQTLNMILI